MGLSGGLAANGGVLAAGGGVSVTAYNVMASPYNAKGDGVTDDTAAIQAAMNAAGVVYGATGNPQLVVYPAGYTFFHGQLTLVNGVGIWAYGATIRANIANWANHALLQWSVAGGPPAWADAGIHGGTWIGSGLEREANNMYWLWIGRGCQDCTIEDCKVTGWGWVPALIANPTRVSILNNRLYGNSVLANTTFQNDISIQNTGVEPCSEIAVRGNFMHNCVADSIGFVYPNGGVTGGPLYLTVDNNIITADAPRIDAACTVNNTNTILDASVTNADLNKYVTGVNCPFVTYITNVTPGVSFRTNNAMTAAAGGVVQSLAIGVYRSTIALEIDANPTNPVTDFAFTNNYVVAYERSALSITLQNNGIMQRGRVQNNTLVNGQTVGPATGGNGIQLGSGNNVVLDIPITGNRVSCPVTPIKMAGTGGKNSGPQTDNKFSTGAAQGQATLVAGTVTVNTAEIQTGDSVILTRQATGGTLGQLSVGTIVAATSFVINSSNAADTSVVYWKIDH